MFATWMLSIVGIVVIGVVIDIIMPEGDTSKFIKGIFAIFTIFVIVSPLPNLISSVNNSAEVAINIDEFDYDYEYVNYVNDLRFLNYEKEVVSAILEKTNYECTAQINQTSGEIKKIVIDFSKTVMFENDNHIFIVETVQDYLTNKFGIKTEQIEFVWKQAQ